MTDAEWKKLKDPTEYVPQRISRIIEYCEQLRDGEQTAMACGRSGRHGEGGMKDEWYFYFAKKPHLETLRHDLVTEYYRCTFDGYQEGEYESPDAAKETFIRFVEDRSIDMYGRNWTDLIVIEMLNTGTGEWEVVADD